MRVSVLLASLIVAGACRPTESANSSPPEGSVMAGGIRVSATTDRNSLPAGQQLRITVTATNGSDTSQTLEFSSGCQTDFELVDSSGRVVATADQMCTMALTSRVLAAGASFSDVHTFARPGAGPGAPAAGQYGVRGVLLLMAGAVRSESVPVTLP